MIDERPMCPNCRRETSPAGGIIGTCIRFWKCFSCGYEIEDIPYEAIINPELLTKLEKQDK